MIEPLMPLPTSADDPRLDDWYHTIELAPGITSRGYYKNQSIADKVGLPASLAGKTCLDACTADGYWAFEMERRGAARVVATDVLTCREYDHTPPFRATLTEQTLRQISIMARRFATAKAMRKSQVEYKPANVYDLSPETVGTFDVVFCGSLLLHIFDPLSALIALRKVTREMAVIETTTSPELAGLRPEAAFAAFGNITPEPVPGAHMTYWLLAPSTLIKMLRYAGFSRVEPKGVFQLEQTPPPGHNWATAAVAYV